LHIYFLVGVFKIAVMTTATRIKNTIPIIVVSMGKNNIIDFNYFNKNS
jgi:hypothetical protein